MHPRTGQNIPQKIETELVQKATQATSRALRPESPTVILLFLYSFKINMSPFQSRALQDLSPRQGRPPSACSADSYQTSIMLNVECENKKEKTNPNQTNRKAINYGPYHLKVFNWFGEKGQKCLIRFRIQGLCRRAGHDVIKQERPDFPILPLFFASDDHLI